MHAYIHTCIDAYTPGMLQAFRLSPTQDFPSVSDAGQRSENRTTAKGAQIRGLSAGFVVSWG